MDLHRLLLFSSILMGILQPTSVTLAQELKTNYFAAVNREVDLVRSIFDETNKTFDAKLCSSLQIQPTQSVEIRYLQVALYVFYPNTNDVGPNYCEMAIPYRLRYQPGRITRLETPTNEIPMNYIRVFDPAKSQVTADLRVFVAVAQSEHPDRIKYLHKSFQFIYREGWKPSESLQRKGEEGSDPDN